MNSAGSTVQIKLIVNVYDKVDILSKIDHIIDIFVKTKNGKLVFVL